MATLEHITKVFSLGTLRLFGRDRSGATTIETTLLVSLLAIAILSGIQEAGSLVTSAYEQVENQVSGAINGGNSANSGNSGDNDDDNEDDDDQGENGGGNQQ